MCAIAAALTGCERSRSAISYSGGLHRAAPARQLDVPATRAASVASDADVGVAELIVRGGAESPAAFLHVWISASIDDRVLEAFSFPLTRPEPGWLLPIGGVHQSRVNGSGVYISASSPRVGSAQIQIDYLEGPTNVHDVLDVEFTRGDGHKDIAGIRIHWGVRRQSGGSTDHAK